MNFDVLSIAVHYGSIFTNTNTSQFFYDDIGICSNPNQYMLIRSVKVLEAKVC